MGRRWEARAFLAEMGREGNLCQLLQFLEQGPRAGEDTQSQLCRPSGLGAEPLADKVCVVISRAPGQPGAVSLRGRASRVLGLPVCEQDIRGCLLALA